MLIPVSPLYTIVVLVTHWEGRKEWEVVLKETITRMCPRYDTVSERESQMHNSGLYYNETLQFGTHLKKKRNKNHMFIFEATYIQSKQQWYTVFVFINICSVNMFPWEWKSALKKGKMLITVGGGASTRSCC